MADNTGFTYFQAILCNLTSMLSYCLVSRRVKKCCSLVIIETWKGNTRIYQKSVDRIDNLPRGPLFGIT